jgi:pterin-4a-carbinolamine dehydratase
MLADKEWLVEYIRQASNTHSLQHLYAPAHLPRLPCPVSDENTPVMSLCRCLLRNSPSNKLRNALLITYSLKFSRAESTAQPGKATKASTLKLHVNTFDPVLPSIPSQGSGRNSSTQLGLNIVVSAKTDPEKLISALNPLLFRPETTSSTPKTTSFGSSIWRLAPPKSDAILRHLAVKSEQEADDIVQAVNAAADSMNHHPHIARENPSPESGNAWLVTIVCTTHRPPGLSMRDVRLARRIDEIVAPYSTCEFLTPTGEGGLPSQDKDINIQKARTRMLNRARN